MTDRDFKLLVREYLVTLMMSDSLENISKANKLNDQIWKELERFSEREQQELPFKEKEI